MSQVTPYIPPAARANSVKLSTIRELYELPFNDLLFKAQQVHREHFNPNEVQMSTLMSIKTGACPEDCGYCSQSGHHNTELEKEPLAVVEEVIEQAKAAKAAGSTRFCMGAAWRSPPSKSMPELTRMVKEVKDLGLETCMTLGMLNAEQASQLKQQGLITITTTSIPHLSIIRISSPPDATKIAWIPFNMFAMRE